MNTPARILIADDNEANRDILATRLEANGYDVLHAADGEEALAITREQRPDLILLDIMMPKLDGLEVCKRLKADAQLPFTPIILVTAKAETGDVVEGLDAGADEYVTKPIDQKALVARVRALLRIKEHHDAADSPTARPSRTDAAALYLFICFSSSDAAVADEVVSALEADGLKCWVSSRDVLPGQNYQEAIVQALESASGVVFLFSAASSKSPEVRKELSLGGSFNVPIFPLRLAPIAPSGALRYELAIRQWIDIFPHRPQALAKLAQTIKQSTHGAPGGAPSRIAEVESGVTAQSSAETAVKASAQPLGAIAAAAPPGKIIEPGSGEFEAIRSLLARHIGPIAKVCVEKAAGQARTPEEFCELLAAYVTDPSQRTSFVRAVRGQLAAKR